MPEKEEASGCRFAEVSAAGAREASGASAADDEFEEDDVEPVNEADAAVDANDAPAPPAAASSGWPPTAIVMFSFSVPDFSFTTPPRRSLSARLVAPSCLPRRDSTSWGGDERGAGATAPVATATTETDPARTLERPPRSSPSLSRDSAAPAGPAHAEARAGIGERERAPGEADDEPDEAPPRRRGAGEGVDRSGGEEAEEGEVWAVPEEHGVDAEDTGAGAEGRRWRGGDNGAETECEAESDGETFREGDSCVGEADDTELYELLVTDAEEADLDGEVNETLALTERLALLLASTAVDSEADAEPVPEGISDSADALTLRAPLLGLAADSDADVARRPGATTRTPRCERQWRLADKRRRGRDVGAPLLGPLLACPAVIAAAAPSSVSLSLAPWRRAGGESAGMGGPGIANIPAGKQPAPGRMTRARWAGVRGPLVRLPPRLAVGVDSAGATRRPGTWHRAGERFPSARRVRSLAARRRE